jgi:DNA-binding LytR/AlgR family response regulator
MIIFICDDVNDDALHLKSIINDSGFNVRTEIFNTGEEVLARISSNKMPDICFLDIVMPKKDGVTVAEQMRQKGYNGHIVFLTITNDYAAQSYKVKAFSYLLKPPDKNEVARLLRELIDSLKAADTVGVLINSKKIPKFILHKDITYIEVIDHKLYYHLTNGDSIDENARISDIMTRLQDRRFAQCHRSFVVNMDEIYQMQGNKVVMNNGKNIPITRYYANFVNTYIGHVLKEDK